MNKNLLNLYNINTLILEEINLLNRYLKIKARKNTKHKQNFQKSLVKLIKQSRVLGILP